VALAEIELARIRKAMDAFMQQRRPAPRIRTKVDLTFRVSGQSVEIFEVRPVWRVFWQRRDLKWHRYEPRPEVKSVEEFASLVSEQMVRVARARFKIEVFIEGPGLVVLGVYQKPLKLRQRLKIRVLGLDSPPVA
jgi:hypothetical protein